MRARCVVNSGTALVVLLVGLSGVCLLANSAGVGSVRSSLAAPPQPVRIRQGASVLAAGSRSDQAAADQVPFRVLDTGLFGGCHRPCYRVIASRDAWQSFWNLDTLNGKWQKPIPKVDFRRYVVVVASMGRVPTTGYRIYVSRVVLAPHFLKVFVGLADPTGGVEFQAENPYQAVEVPRSKHSIQFVVEEDDVGCPMDLWVICVDPRSAQQEGFSMAAGGQCFRTFPNLYQAICYQPAEVDVAQRLLAVHPFDPSSLITRLTGLLLTRVIVVRLYDSKSQGLGAAVAIHYIFGRIPDNARAPMGSHRGSPTFVDVEETASRDLDSARSGIKPLLGRLVIDRDQTGQAIPVWYGPWELQARLIAQKLGLIVMANENGPAVRQLGLNVLAAARG